MSSKKTTKIMENIGELEGKNCIITGASDGIGKAIALKLSEKKCNLILVGRNLDKLKKIKEEITKKRKNKIKVFSIDLSDQIKIKQLIKKIRNDKYSIDVLINCAGVFPVKLLQDTSYDEYVKCFNVNVLAPVILTKEFSKDMKKKKWGRIVNIGSSGSYNGKAKTSVYRATKHAILGFSRAITKELRNYNVRMFCVSPGPTKTNMGKKIVNKENKDEKFETFIEPKDIAKFITDLISYDSEMYSQEIRLGRIIGEK